MKKKFLSILLALAMCLSLLPTAALAAEAVTYLDADGHEQTCSNYTTVTDSTEDVTWSSGWYVVSDFEATIDGSVTITGDVHLILCDGTDLKVMKGIGYAGGTAGSLTVYGQSGSSGYLTVTGSDSDGDETYVSSDGIYVRSLTVNGGNVYANGGGAVSATGIAGSYGVYAKDVTVNAGDLNAGGEPSEAENSTVNMSSGSEDDYAEGVGIYAYGTLTVNGGEITGGGAWANTTGKSNAYSYGIYAGSMTVTGGAVTAYGYLSNTVNGEAHSYGIYIADGLTVSGGEIYASGNGVEARPVTGNGYAYSGGIYAAGPVAITGGEVEAETGPASSICGEASVMGLYTRKTLSVTGGTLTAQSSSASIPSEIGIAGSAYTYGICAEGDVTICATVQTTAGPASGKQQQYSDEAASFGLYTPVQLTVSDGGNLTATGGAAALNGNNNSTKIYSYGVYAKDMAVSGSAVVTASGDTASKSYGVKTARTMTVSGGTLTATGVEADADSKGIYAVDALTISGGTVKATSGDVSASNSANSEGIRTDRLTLSGGTIAEAVSGDASVTNSYANAYSRGIGASVMSVSGGTIEGVRPGKAESTSQDGHAYAYGVYALNLDVSGGTIDAEMTGDKNITVSGGAVQTLVLADSSAPCLSGGTFGKIQYAELKNALADGYAYFTKPEGGEDYDTIVKVDTLGQYDKDHPLEAVQVAEHECGFGEEGNVHPCAVCGRGGSASAGIVSYLDYNGVKRERVDYTVVTSDTTALENGWYVVNGNVTVGELSVLGNVHLILCDNAALKAAQIKYTYSDDTFANLTVYAQSKAEDTMGSLTVESTTNDSINLYSGVLTVAGGSVSATTASGSGIRGDLNLLNGSVTAQGTAEGLHSGNITVSGGTLTATATGSAHESYGIYCTSIMTVSGSGKVYATAGPSEHSDNQGIYLSFKSMTVSGNGEVYATGGQNSGSYGICGIDNAGVIVTDNGKLTATGGTATNGNSIGIYLRQDLIVSGNGKVTATGGAATNGNSYGFYGVYDADQGYNAGVTVSGNGVFTATSSNAANSASGKSYGIYSQGRINLSGSGKITATAGTSDAESSGIRCDRELTVSGGTLKAQGDSYGVYVYSGAPMTVYGGKLDCDELIVLGTANISGGTVTGKITVGDMNNHIYGKINISGGTFEEVSVLCGKMSISGGTFCEASVGPDATATLSGGTFDELYAIRGADPNLLNSLADGYAFYTKNTNTEISPVTEMKGSAQISVVRNAQIKVYIADNSSGSSSSGGGGSSNTTSTTVKNENGSTTTTTINKKTGEVLTTTKNPDGVTGTTVTDKNGNVTDISAKVPASAVKDGQSVELPIDEVKPAEKSEDATEIKITVPSGGATVVIPVENPTAGTTVVIVDKNGNETVVPGSKVTENGIEITLTEDATIKVIDNSKNFDDVPENAYFADAVAWASSRGITGGVGNNRFGPDLSCTRAQIVTFLWRAAGCPEVKSTSGFADVSADSFYAEAVAWAVENGITGGIGNNQFAPDLTCTRAQAAAFLFRYAASQGMDAVTLQELVGGYGDAASVPSYALPAFNWALAQGILQGYNGNLMPNNDCTRAQIVTMLYRMLGE